MAAGLTRHSDGFCSLSLPLVFAWWAIGQGDAGSREHHGEINAWFIARFGWADITPLLQTEAVGESMAPLGRAAGCQPCRCSRRLARPTRRAAVAGFGARWHWRTLLVATLVFVLLSRCPGDSRRWRPQLPPTWVEPAVAALRLGARISACGSSGPQLLIIASSRTVARGALEPAGSAAA